MIRCLVRGGRGVLRVQHPVTRGGEPPHMAFVGGSPDDERATKKNLKKKALHTSGDSAEHPLSMAVRSLPLPFPILSPPLLLLQAAFCGGMVSELRALQQPGLEYWY
eukprot:scaffold32197_cov107-Isochrysis_galbana.AAC.1